MLEVAFEVNNSRSQALFEEAREFTPAGSPNGRNVGTPPLYFHRAQGSRLFDTDANEYLDLWSAAGHIILGHGHPEVNQAAWEALQECGAQIGMPNTREIALARRLKDCIPCAEKVFFLNGGSDANGLAVRVARAATGRKKVIKFEGGLQGWADTLSASYAPPRSAAGEASAPNLVPETQGIPPEVFANTIPMTYNNLEALTSRVEQEKGDIAAILLEPMVHSVNLMPKPGYLEGVRKLCDAFGIVLIFDEVVTGFRHGLGGAQGVLGVTPDLGTFSKSMSNGFVISALCGKKEYMSLVGPEGPARMTLTFSGNALSTSAALKTTEILGRPGFYERLYKMGDTVRTELNRVIKDLGVRARCDGFGSVWLLYFDRQAPENYRDVLDYMESGGAEKDAAYRTYMVNHGIMVWPQKLNRCYFNASHTEEEVQRVVDVTVQFLKEHRQALS